MSWRKPLAVVAFWSSCCFGQELLTNPSFTEPALTDCTESFADVTGWTWSPNANGGNGDRRNGDFEQPPCPRNGDGVRASLQGWGSESTYFYQTVTGITPGTPLRFSGQWYYSHLFLCCGSLTVSAQIREGNDPNAGAVIASTQQVIQGTNTGGWLPFSICGNAGTSEVTVVIRAQNTDFIGYALHVDALSLLEVPACTAANTVTSLDPVYAVCGDTIDDAQVTGEGFVPGLTSVKLSRTGAPDIVATDVQVSGSTQLTCDFDLTGAANGRWNLVVDFPASAPAQAILPGALLVVLPALSNGSFELPAAPGACPASPIPGTPTDWLKVGLGSWADGGQDATTVYRDSGQVTPPGCPPPDGDHYASTYSIPPNPGAQPESLAWQTLKVDSTKTYTFSGYFAGSGAHQVLLELLDGDELAPVLETTVVHDGGGDYDWTFAYVQGQPGGDLMTVRWRITTRNPGPHVAHADALSFDVCETALAVDAVTPEDGDNTGVLTGVTVTGSGFAGGTPQVLLTRPAAVAINGANVTVINDTTLTVDLDLSGRNTGTYDLVVVRDGCAATLEDAFIIARQGLFNAGFELPDASPIDCGPPAVTIFGTPLGWTFSTTDSIGRMDRDHNVWSPQTCPSPTGGHYGSLTIDRGATLRAFQVLRVQPDYRYTVSGQFAGGGNPNDVRLLLLDGGETGTVIASGQVHAQGDTVPYDWATHAVMGSPGGDLMTVVWELEAGGNSEEGHASHADGLSISELPPLCHNPFADADGDDDVDQEDFAFFQRCATGNMGETPVDPEYCQCFDRDEDGDVDQTDFSSAGGFQACAGRPGVPADPACDDPLPQ